MVDPRPTRNRARMREALLRRLQSAPFEDISIRDITTAADISYTTFFRLYGTKEALIADLAVEEVRELYELTIENYLVRDNVTRCRAICHHVEQRWAIWSALLAGATNYIKAEMICSAERTLANTPDGPIPKELRASIGVNALVDVLSWWSRQHSRPSAEKVAEILVRVLLPRE